MDQPVRRQNGAELRAAHHEFQTLNVCVDLIKPRSLGEASSARRSNAIRRIRKCIEPIAEVSPPWSVPNRSPCRATRLELPPEDPDDPLFDPGLVIPERSPLSIRSTRPGPITACPTWPRMVDVRVYQGIHFRSADEVARRQGMRAADWAVSHVLRPSK